LGEFELLRRARREEAVARRGYGVGIGSWSGVSFSAVFRTKNVEKKMMPYVFKRRADVSFAEARVSHV
jgi:hypothetical protein